VDGRGIPIPKFETNIPERPSPHSDIPVKALQDAYDTFSESSIRTYFTRG